MCSILYFTACSDKKGRTSETRLTIVSGDLQSAEIGQELPEPAKVLLTKENGEPIPNSPLEIHVAKGKGNLIAKDLMTDENGEAEVNWIMGEDYFNQLSIVFMGTDQLSSSSIRLSAKSLYPYQAPENIEGWESSLSTLDAVGLDEKPILDMINGIRSEKYPRIHDVTIIRHGKLVFDLELSEENLLRPGLAGLTRHDRNHYIASATKSIVSAVVGVAIDNHIITSERDSLFNYFMDAYPNLKNWDDSKWDISLADLLTMRAGYECQDGGPGNGWIEAGDLVRYVLERPMINPPGTVFSYCSGSTAVLGQVVAKASGQTFEKYADENFFGPLGISSPEYHYHKSGIPSLGHGIWMKPPDMAKIGQLFLNKGVWNGTRVLSEEWIEKSIKPRFRLSNGFDYSFYWYSGDVRQKDKIYKFYHAAGNGGQLIFFSYDVDMVVVFTAGNYDDAQQSIPTTLLKRYVVPSILN